MQKLSCKAARTIRSAPPCGWNVHPARHVTNFSQHFLWTAVSVRITCFNFAIYSSFSLSDVRQICSFFAFVHITTSHHFWYFYRRCFLGNRLYLSEFQFARLLKFLDSSHHNFVNFHRFLNFTQHPLFFLCIIFSLIVSTVVFNVITDKKSCSIRFSSFVAHVLPSSNLLSNSAKIFLLLVSWCPSFEWIVLKLKWFVILQLKYWLCCAQLLRDVVSKTSWYPVRSQKIRLTF